MALQERSLGPDHPETATGRIGLGDILMAQGRANEAEPMIRRGVGALEKAIGADNPDLAEPLFLLAILLVALQTISLPESIKQSLSPHMDRLLPAWGDNPETSTGLGRWSSLSFAPWQTWSDLITLTTALAVGI